MTEPLGGEGYNGMVDIIIAVMGPTGTGKTSFINLLSGTNLQVGEGLESCTETVQLSEPFTLDGHRITMIDTPGFDDSNLKDTDVLAMIAAHLSFVRKHGKILSGVIYMHRIQDVRMGGISSRNFKMFRHLCGDSSLQNVVIVTNMWSQVDYLVGEAREKELASKDIFFKPALEKGARMTRHDDTVESGQAIVRSLLQRKPQPLQIQRELEAGMDLSQTAAGKQLNSELMEQIARHKEEMRVLVEEMTEAHRVRDQETRQELAEERARLETEIVQLQTLSENLSTGYTETIAKLEQKMKDMESSATVTGSDSVEARDLRIRIQEQYRRMVTPDNAVLEAKLGGAFPIFGFWGKVAVMLSPFSLSWR